jgi:hypothetical protein
VVTGPVLMAIRRRLGQRAVALTRQNDAAMKRVFNADTLAQRFAEMPS